jgi:hypothetical protein
MMRHEYIHDLLKHVDAECCAAGSYVASYYNLIKLTAVVRASNASSKLLCHLHRDADILQYYVSGLQTVILVGLVTAEGVFQVSDLIVSEPMIVIHTQTLPEMLVDTH